MLNSYRWPVLCSMCLTVASHNISLSKWFYNIYSVVNFSCPSHPQSLNLPLRTSPWMAPPPPLPHWPGLHQIKRMGWSNITRSCMRMNPTLQWWTHPLTESLWSTWSHSLTTTCLWGHTRAMATATKRQTLYTCCLERTVCWWMHPPMQIHIY